MEIHTSNYSNRISEFGAWAWAWHITRSPEVRPSSVAPRRCMQQNLRPPRCNLSPSRPAASAACRSRQVWGSGCVGGLGMSCTLASGTSGCCYEGCLGRKTLGWCDVGVGAQELGLFVSGYFLSSTTGQWGITRLHTCRTLSRHSAPSSKVRKAANKGVWGIAWTSTPGTMKPSTFPSSHISSVISGPPP